MTIKEKFQKLVFDIEISNEKLIEKSEKIADEYAIGFANFIDDLIGEYGLFGFKENFGKKTTEELLEIYKKEKGL